MRTSTLQSARRGVVWEMMRLDYAFMMHLFSQTETLQEQRNDEAFAILANFQCDLVLPPPSADVSVESGPV